MKFSLRCCNSSCYIFRCVIKGWKENFVEQYLSKYKRDVTTYLALISAYAFYISQLPCCLWQNFNIRLYIIKKKRKCQCNRILLFWLAKGFLEFLPTVVFLLLSVGVIRRKLSGKYVIVVLRIFFDYLLCWTLAVWSCSPMNNSFDVMCNGSIDYCAVGLGQIKVPMWLWVTLVFSRCEMHWA